MSAGLLLIRPFPLRMGAATEVTPAGTPWEELFVAHEPAPGAGPVAVEVAYRIAADQAEAFLDALTQMRAPRASATVPRCGASTATCRTRHAIASASSSPPGPTTCISGPAPRRPTRRSRPGCGSSCCRASRWSRRTSSPSASAVARVTAATSRVRWRPGNNRRAMGTLYLVRHGQASFGADDYDLLSELGQRQCAQLGALFPRARAGVRGRAGGPAAAPGAVARSHRRCTLGTAGADDGLARPRRIRQRGGDPQHPPRAARAKPDTPELVRHHFRLLREGLARWMAGETARRTGMPSYRDFAAGVAAALDRVREQPHRRRAARLQRRADLHRGRPGAGHAGEPPRSS